jgi:hypothetical protein
LTSIGVDRGRTGGIAAGFVEVLKNIASGGLSELQTLPGADAD